MRQVSQEVYRCACLASILCAGHCGLEDQGCKSSRYIWRSSIISLSSQRSMEAKKVLANVLAKAKQPGPCIALVVVPPDAAGRPLA